MNPVLVRSAAARVVFVALLALLTMAGSAHAAPPGVPATAQVASALFTPTRDASGLDWHAEWVLTPESAEEIGQGETRVIRFAMPLRETETVDTLSGVVPLSEAGQVVGVVVNAGALEGRRVTAKVHQRMTSGSRNMHLGAPVASGHALQIVDGDLKTGTRLELEPGRSFEKHVGYLTSPGVSHAAREEARRLTGYEARVSGAAIYVRGDDVSSAGGLTATLETPRERSRHGAVGIAVVFGAVVLALVAAVRRLRHAAGVERADAILAAEVDALGGEGRR